MADNLSVTPGTGTALRTTEAGGVHTPHHLEDATQRTALLAALAALDPDTGLAAIVTALQATLAVSAASLPLPTGAATQTTLAAILAKIIAAPATEAKQDSNTAAVALVGTRAYGAPAARVAVASATAYSAPLAATEVLLHASTRCFVGAVAGSGTPTVNNTNIPLEIGEKFHMRLTSGQRVAVIRDTADGFLNVIPVA